MMMYTNTFTDNVYNTFIMYTNTFKRTRRIILTCTKLNIQKLKYILLNFRHEKHDFFKYTANLLEIIASLNANGLLENTQLLLFDIVNMFPNIYNMKGVEPPKFALDR